MKYSTNSIKKLPLPIYQTFPGAQQLVHDVQFSRPWESPVNSHLHTKATTVVPEIINQNISPIQMYSHSLTSLNFGVKGVCTNNTHLNLNYINYADLCRSRIRNEYRNTMNDSGYSSPILEMSLRNHEVVNTIKKVNNLNSYNLNIVIYYYLYKIFNS